MLQAFALLLLLLQPVASFHFYCDVGEERCFTEDIPSGTQMVGGYKVELWDSTRNTFSDTTGSQVIFSVRNQASGNILVSMTGKQAGKFHFTSTEHGVHYICLYVHLIILCVFYRALFY